ncbi:MAG: DUF2520 domain-containing protein [Acidobacteriia bacterium]|nr:DUF2520 domain-containing protein [Terriglobia bacterium]
MNRSMAILGGGRVGRALGKRLCGLGWRIGAVVTRSAGSARRAVRFIGAGQAYGRLTRQLLGAQLILIAVPDRALADVAGELARIGGEELRGKVVLHTSGALDARVLGAVRACGAAVGSMHPLQTFSGVGVPPLEGKVFAIEGDAAALRVARQIIRALKGVPVRIPGEKKPLYHAACALAAGHVLAVMEAATQMLLATGMKRREALRALLPLTRQMLENFERLGPATAWTGPLSRGDYGVVAAHAAALREFPPAYGAAHEALARLGAAVLARRPEEARAALDRIFEEAKLQKKASGGKG